VTICDIAWTEERSKVGLLPDPLYYVPVMLTQRKGEPELTKIDDLQGKRIGLINGYSWNTAFTNLPGVEVKTFADAPAVLADLAAGRIDVAPTDPLVTDVAIAERPDWSLESHRIDPPTDAQIAEDKTRIRLLPTQAGWMVADDEPELAQALSGEIRRMSSDGELAKILAKWQVPDVEAWLTVPGDYIAEQRHGVDRDESWQPPSWPAE
jgi:polar amino acid transport system substrate-binding protein